MRSFLPGRHADPQQASLAADWLAGRGVGFEGADNARCRTQGRSREWRDGFERSVRGVAAAALIAVLAGCASQPSSPGTPVGAAQAQPTCGTVEVVQDSHEMEAAVTKMLERRRVRATSIRVRALRIQCDDASLTQQAPSATTSADMDIEVVFRDLYQVMPVSQITSKVLLLLDRATPETSGKVTLTLVNGDDRLTLSFTRDTGRKAREMGLQGANLLAALGYPPVARDSSPCTPVWGKQLLVDLSQQARAAFDRSGLSAVEVAAAANGAWCGDEFSPTDVEYHIRLGWLDGITSRNKEELGNILASMTDALDSLPQQQTPGMREARVIILLGADEWLAMSTSLEAMRAARAASLSGAALVEELFK